ncbi:MAG: rhodanese-like domain-containing protein [Chitinophagaceae bacterium]|nr:MAG: rhodanese-like domain-containing protein [Chitinophagaceae bacterium]
MAQQTTEDPWKQNQLMAPADLAAILNNINAAKPVIFSIGPSAYIKGSIDVGDAKEKENLKKLKEQVSKLPKDANIVLYCGCCPFDHCPNIRPAFNLLNKMKFTNHKLLNLEHNIKIDWLNKGYPRN